MPGNIERGSTDRVEHEVAREIYRTSLQNALSLYGITPQVRAEIEGSSQDASGVRLRNLIGLSFESAIDLSDIPLPDNIAEFFRSQGKEEMRTTGIKRAHLGFSVAYLEMRSESKLNMWSFDLVPHVTFNKQPVQFSTPATIIRSLAEIAKTIAQRPHESSAVITQKTPEDNSQRSAKDPHNLYHH